MPHKGSQVYDNDAFFNAYIKKRGTKKTVNDLLEQPIIDELLGDVTGKDLLDLGCGDGLYGKELLNRGGSSYHGIDGSKNMLNLAEANLKDSTAHLEHTTLEMMELGGAQYDLILSRLAFHYVEDLEKVFQKMHASLRSGGEVVFSIEHPVITSNYTSYNDKAIIKRQDWIVDNYFKSGQRVNVWIGEEVVKYHKTLEEYFQLFKNTGFVLEELRESKPVRARFNDEKEYERRQRVPLFLIIKLRKRIV